jgi:hypothetical protein
MKFNPSSIRRLKMPKGVRSEGGASLSGYTLGDFFRKFTVFCQETERNSTSQKQNLIKTGK